MEKFKKDFYYKSKQVIYTPNGIVRENAVFSGERWEDILVYGIGNCGINAMFDIVDKPDEIEDKEMSEDVFVDKMMGIAESVRQSKMKRSRFNVLLKLTKGELTVEQADEEMIILITGSKNK